MYFWEADDWVAKRKVPVWHLGGEFRIRWDAVELAVYEFLDKKRGWVPCSRDYAVQKFPQNRWFRNRAE
jgi:hypothetical protein